MARRPRRAIGLIAGALVSCAWAVAGDAPRSCAGGVRAEQATSAPAIAAPSVEARLVSPTLGRPVFASAGGTFQVVAQVPEASAAPVFELVSDVPPACRYLLSADDDVRTRLPLGQGVSLRVPGGLPPRTYDLQIIWGGSCVVGRHCVAVGTMPRRVRLVHLSDMNVGDLGAPDFDARLIDEVNLVSPTLIVATGDYLDAMHDDVGQGWQRIADFFSRFDAPALLACGDHDDPESYGRVVAASLAGTISVGELRGVVLFDVPGRPISDDVEQIRWLEQALAVPGDDRLAFVVAHDESPNLLRAWQRRGVLGDMIKATRLGVWFAGGHRDWDGVEYRALVDGASPMLYLRTHESSEAVRDGATGISHYRIVDLTRERAWLPGAELDELRPSESVPVGRLSVSLAAPNDGSRTCVAITAVNNLPYRVDRLGVRVVLKRTEGATPWCLGGELESAEPVGDCWECRVRFDLPDKGAVQGLVGGGPQPAQPKVEVLFDTVRQLHLTQRASRDGLVFQTAPETLALIHLHNAGTSAAAVTPLVRLDGEALSYTVLDEPGPAAAAYRLRLAPGAMLTLQVDLTAIRVAPGVRELQVYLKGPAVWSPACCPLEVSVGPQ